MQSNLGTEILFMGLNTLTQNKKEGGIKTHLLLIGSTILDEPLIASLALLSVILKKDLDASLLQIAILTMIRPIMAVFSFYWSSLVKGRRSNLRSNLFISGLLERVPFLFIPFIDNVWFIILAASLYALFHRAGMPALMEILKLNLKGRSRNKLFSLTSAIGYSEGIILGLLLGKGLDLYPGSWRVLFFFSSLLAIGSVFARALIPIPESKEEPPLETSKSTFLHKILAPWKKSYSLLKMSPEFLDFQMGFMICGFGLMLIIPSFPSFVTALNISYFDLILSMAIFKGVGYVCATPFWTHALSRYHLNHLSSLLNALFGLYCLALIFTTHHIFWLYGAYFIYGISQAGSRLIWHLSGPIFSKDGESGSFSIVNILTVGLRGVLGPLCGYLICKNFGATAAFYSGMVCCFYGSFFMLTKTRRSLSMSAE